MFGLCVTDFELMIPLKGPRGGPIEKIILGDSRKIEFSHGLGHELPLALQKDRKIGQT
jgi:hypothetical protein